MKRQAGDTVIIKKNLKENKIYGTGVAVEEMMPFRGRTVTIAKQVDNIDYKIVEDGQIWYWTDEMFENQTNESYKTAIIKMQNKIISRMMCDILTHQ